jgi:hypothetical protein
VRRVAIILAAVLFAASCGDDSSSEQASTASTTTSTTSTTPPTTSTTPPTTTEAPTTAPLPIERPFEIARAVDYVGQTLEIPPEGYFDWGGMRTESLTVTPEDDPRVVLMQTLQPGVWPPDEPAEEGPRVEMVLAGHNPGGFNVPLEVTDGVVLTTSDPTVWLFIQCFDPDGVGNVAVYWEPQDGVRTVVQAWEYDVDLAKLVDIEPDSFRRHSGCKTPER